MGREATDSHIRLEPPESNSCGEGPTCAPEPPRSGWHCASSRGLGRGRLPGAEAIRGSQISESPSSWFRARAGRRSSAVAPIDGERAARIPRFDPVQCSWRDSIRTRSFCSEDRVSRCRRGDLPSPNDRLPLDAVVVPSTPALGPQCLKARWRRSAHRWTEQHPFVLWLPLAGIQLVIAVFRQVQTVCSTASQLPDREVQCSIPIRRRTARKRCPEVAPRPCHSLMLCSFGTVSE